MTKRASDYFDRLVLEDSFEDIKLVTIENGTNAQSVYFGWNGIEITFTFKGEFNDLNRILSPKKEEVAYQRRS